MKTFYDNSIFPDIFDDISDYHEDYEGDNTFDLNSIIFNKYIDNKLVDDEIHNISKKEDFMSIMSTMLWTGISIHQRNYIRYGFYGIYDQPKTFRGSSKIFFYLDNKQSFSNNSYKTTQTFEVISRRKKD